ncbi:hypothetical protein, partial [Mycobacteroides abscessus]|uniref:hypothetical protein n=1 Tax=Mycobacteroides abscessus TaxID=36809 RepID=UPI002D769F3C
RRGAFVSILENLRLRKIHEQIQGIFPNVATAWRVVKQRLQSRCGESSRGVPAKRCRHTNRLLLCSQLTRVQSTTTNDRGVHGPNKLRVDLVTGVINHKLRAIAQVFQQREVRTRHSLVSTSRTQKTLGIETPHRQPVENLAAGVHNVRKVSDNEHPT